jgi:membrane protein DedA with SNARE-associated domain/rhodanese-related sulfurtransferase
LRDYSAVLFVKSKPLSSLIAAIKVNICATRLLAWSGKRQSLCEITIVIIQPSAPGAFGLGTRRRVGLPGRRRMDIAAEGSCMNEMVHFLQRHGYWLVFVSLLGGQAGLPVPGNLILLAAGALAASGKLNLAAIVFLSALALALADLGWFQAGRKWGKRILHFACGISKDPGGCVRKAEESFGRHGLRLFLGSKFVIGIDAVAVPLAGASGTARTQFLFFDALGATLWSGVYATLGYVFRKQLDLVAAYAGRMGVLVVILLAAALGFYLVRKAVRWLRFVHEFRLARITPEQLWDKLRAGDDILILDVRRNGGSVQELQGIPGAVRIDPHHIERDIGAMVPVDTPDRHIVIYCTCPSEFTSARVALALRRRGFLHVWPLAGGLHAWCDRCFPVTKVAPATPAPPS